MMIGVVVVDSVIDDFGDGTAYLGGSDRDRSNIAGEGEYNQWLGGLPMRARPSGGASFSVVSMVEVGILQYWKTYFKPAVRASQNDAFVPARLKNMGYYL